MVAKSFLIINKGTMEVYERTELAEAAFIVGRPEDDIRWSLKRTGRWDRDDEVIIVIPSDTNEYQDSEDSEDYGITQAELDELAKTYPEGVPNWMKDRPVEDTKQLMELRRKAFPKTIKETS